MTGIRFHRLSFAYPGHASLFHDLDLDLTGKADAPVLALMGPSGSGKSTLLRLLLGLEKPTSGRIEFDPGRPVITYVPQEPVLFEHLPVEDNARYFALAGAHRDRFDTKLYQQLVIDLGLADVVSAKRPISHLSGGQRQRLSMLRALSIRPDVLLLDEPCNGLDAAVKRSFLIGLRKIAERNKLRVVYVTHHVAEAEMVADEVLYLSPHLQRGEMQAHLATMQDFLHAPPTVDAALAHGFPGANVISDKASGTSRVVHVTAVTKDFSKGDWRVISSSALFTFLEHQVSGTELIVPKAIASGLALGDEVNVQMQIGPTLASSSTSLNVHEE